MARGPLLPGGPASAANLAKDLDIGVEPLRRVLHELREKGMPLHREDDHPHVYWSVPKDWFPNSVPLSARAH